MKIEKMKYTKPTLTALNVAKTAAQKGVGANEGGGFKEQNNVNTS